MKQRKQEIMVTDATIAFDIINKKIKEYTCNRFNLEQKEIISYAFTDIYQFLRYTTSNDFREKADESMLAFLLLNENGSTKKAIVFKDSYQWKIQDEDTNEIKTTSSFDAIAMEIIAHFNKITTIKQYRLLRLKGEANE